MNEYAYTIYNFFFRNVITSNNPPNPTNPTKNNGKWEITYTGTGMDMGGYTTDLPTSDRRF